MQMVMKRRIWLGAVIALAFLTVYIGAIVRNLGEKNRRSLELTDTVTAANSALVSIQVIKIDPATRQLTARLRFRLSGDIAQDLITPRVNLKLLTNSSPGQHVFQFSEGAGIVRIEATFPLEGDPNRYPFDRYESTIFLFMDTPRRKDQSPASQAEPAIDDDVAQPVEVANLVQSEMRENVSVPLSIAVLASTPGMKFTGQVIRSKDIGVTRVRLNLERPENLKNASILVMCLMMGLALSVLAMVITAITFRGNFEVIPLSLAVSLIFGLPALRNIQPNVPPIGVLGDYFSFIWAEMFVAAAAIMMAVTWVNHQRRKAEPKP
jgi:membrane-associated protease RseP (regulator of RpoE activity)